MNKALKIEYSARKIIEILFELYSKITNQGFFCRALKGDSSYNICINSDLSVSCNCNDKFGSGKIGCLKKQDFKEIFSGIKATQFRRMLAKGKLPTVNCIFCPDLFLINKNLAGKYTDNFNVPKGIMIENTINCNLNCLSCNREQICSLRNKKSMSLKDIKKISLLIKKNNIKEISYFNLGEPFFSKKIKKELEIIKKYNPNITITTSTNGLLLNSKEKKEAALLLDKIIFSIHGSTQDSLTRYQRGGDFKKAYSNMANLVKLRDSLKRKKPIIIWKYLLFRWNDNKRLILHAIKLAKKAKIDQIYFEKTLSPPFGISYKYYLNQGYLNKISSFDKKICAFQL